MQDEFAGLPGAELVSAGLRDLNNNVFTENSLLLLVAGPRLRKLGIMVPICKSDESFEHRLYALIEKKRGVSAHSYYNSLVRRIVSFSRALSHINSRAQNER